MVVRGDRVINVETVLSCQVQKYKCGMTPAVSSTKRYTTLYSTIKSIVTNVVIIINS